MALEQKLSFHKKDILITLSRYAQTAAKQLNTPLIIEIQIYFSCLLGKRLAFYSDSEISGVQIIEAGLFTELLNSSKRLTNNIYVRFNTVMTKTCSVSDYSGPPPVSDFKIANQKPYVPNWLDIDFKNDLWAGEYGWNNSDKSYSNTKQIRSSAQKA
ncbi:hypothetical protein MNBD_GAMMA09-3458 [hydrothermal vent metagenome]|uniref:Uncharacterized protein n=1 Tax=hydrothermal vent metagenome TaxID=652676 RepID=A0A3B0YC07_9ZZZZ